MFTRPSVRVLVVLVLLFLGLASLPANARTWQHEYGSVSLEDTPKRIVTLNWAATEALLLLGVTPVGMADRDGYKV
ncbi:MAG TPA: iron-siderophore ABC transporter substrate-binding protein, partial [Marinobacter sp.]